MIFKSSRFAVLAVAAVFVAVVAIAAVAPATTNGNDGSYDPNALDIGRGPLDGMVFVGKIGPEGNPDKYDELHFSEGQFWSWQCTKCGFEPGNYWVRTVGDSLHFQGWLHSADRGQFQYAGRVVDGRIEVTINWTKKRWYWSIDRNLSFVGTLAPPKTAMSALDAKRLAAGAEPEKLAQCRRL